MENVVSNLFDGLSLEVYYGFNMKCELDDLKKKHPDEFAVIERFVDHCRTERLAHEPIK